MSKNFPLSFKEWAEAKDIRFIPYQPISYSTCEEIYEEMIKEAEIKIAEAIKNHTAK